MTTSPLPGWPHPESPFHDGERAVQERLGVAGKIEMSGRRVIRDFMPDQHRDFFMQLPFVLLGSVDADGQPRASVMYGEPGFMSAPDARHLELRGRLPVADPLRETIAPGAALGLLGIEPHTRRRNRMNGTVERMDDDGTIRMHVHRSFGNCPKYIQAREAQLIDASEAQPHVRRALVLDERMKKIVRHADTLFIATAVGEEPGPAERPHGADVSHRGGKPGFVRVDGNATLTVPDFVGNFLFNTLGNIVANPRAGLLFIDFSNGDLLYLAADAEIIWDGEEVASFEGAQRLLRLRVRDATLVERGLPMRWSSAELSPHLDATGSWQGASAQD
jgi:predicted pyridoxine 5'-phosphate oxidase superfamily flavin-nucleotide-binding protein